MESREKESPATASSKTFRFRPLHVAVLVPVLAVAGLWIWRGCSLAIQWAQNATKTPSFSDASDKLKQTCVVPTLDSPLPAGRNVIWCSSFQLAWNELRDKIIGAPLEVGGAQEIADRLNAAKPSVSDLDARSVYAAGGWVQKGICETIKKDMAAKFPSHALPDFTSHMDGILAYSYLTARVHFKYAFRQKDEGLTFVDSQGVWTQVAGFGLWEAYRPAYKKIREQVEILYLKSANERQPWMLTEYALDLCRHSKPYQVVVARVELKNSLAETLEHVHAQMADFERLPGYKDRRQLNESDELEVPEMFWRLDHRFKELIGRTIGNVDMPIVEALQTIEFRLDRFGVALESEALFAEKSESRYLSFNRPFLVYMQKRGAEHPFFVMWVDNAELLTHR